MRRVAHGVRLRRLADSVRPRRVFACSPADAAPCRDGVAPRAGTPTNTESRVAHRFPLLVLLALLSLAALGIVPAHAADPCPLLRAQQQAPDAATRVAAVACEEHMLWHRPFIGADGRLASSTVREAENALLSNGEQAWRRVAMYWRDTGLLAQAAGRQGAGECAYAATSFNSPGCRGFVVDVPWSAAWISWALRRAMLPGFNGATSHIAYVRDAYRNTGANAYRMADPATTAPAVGDMLCYVRANSRIYGFTGLQQVLGASGDSMGMHCDIVVGLDAGASAYLVGGNVFDAVTMRVLPLAADGRFAELPRRDLASPACAPDNPVACSMNRQDWAALLKLRPAAELATLAPALPMVAPGGATPQQSCCVYCVVGGGLPRCPSASSPASPTAQPPVQVDGD